MRPLVRSVLPPSQRNVRPTFGQDRALVREQRIEKLSMERRKMIAAQNSTTSDYQPTLKRRGEMLEHQIGRLQGKINSNS